MLKRIEGQEQEVVHALKRFAGGEVFLHLELTMGAYAKRRGIDHPAGVLMRNGRVISDSLQLLGNVPYRLGMTTDDGYVLVEGLTHWRLDAASGVLGLYALAQDEKLGAAVLLSQTPLSLAGRREARWQEVHFEQQEATAALEGLFAEAGMTTDAGWLAWEEENKAVSRALDTKLRQTVERVLAIFPHPDDETFAAGGTLAAFSLLGKEVSVLCLTRGDLARGLGYPLLADRLTLPTVREAELKEAVRVLGARRLIIGDLHDKMVEQLGDEMLSQLLVPYLKRLRPDLIITYYPDYAVHPDHDAVGRAVRLASRRAGHVKKNPFVLGAAFSERTEELGPPQLELPLSPVLWAVKRAAMRAHRTQVAHLDAELQRITIAEPENEPRFRQEQFWEV